MVFDIIDLDAWIEKINFNSRIDHDKTIDIIKRYDAQKTQCMEEKKKGSKPVVHEIVSMKISGYKTRSVFDR